MIDSVFEVFREINREHLHAIWEKAKNANMEGLDEEEQRLGRIMLDHSDQKRKASGSTLDIGQNLFVVSSIKKVAVLNERILLRTLFCYGGEVASAYNRHFRRAGIALRARRRT